MTSLKSITSGGSSQASGDIQSRIDAYRDELYRLSEDDFKALLRSEKTLELEQANAKREAEDAARFFNQETASLDVSYWARISYWTPDEAVAISFNKDPRIVKLEKLKSLTGISKFAAQYEAKKVLLDRAITMGQLLIKTTPANFLAWANRTNFEMPKDLVKAVEQTGVQVSDWKSRYDRQVKLTADALETAQNLHETLLKNEQTHKAHTESLVHSQNSVLQKHIEELNRIRAELDEANLKISVLDANKKADLRADSKLNPRVKDTLLKMIIGMAIDYYGFSPDQLRSPFPRELSDILAGKGLDVSDDTIRNYLREAAQLLPRDHAE